jgi:hypothetical protein
MKRLPPAGAIYDLRLMIYDWKSTHVDAPDLVHVWPALGVDRLRGFRRREKCRAKIGR